MIQYAFSRMHQPQQMSTCIQGAQFGHQVTNLHVYAANMLLKYFEAAQDGENHSLKSPIQIDWLGFKQAICESDENENLTIQRMFDQILAQ